MTICLIYNSIINNRISREETEKKRNNHNKNMASGNGLSELDVKIKNFVTVDLVAAVRMNETILFVSLREILEGKTNISDTRMVYPKKKTGSLDKEVLKTLETNNPLIKVTGVFEKRIVFKKKMEDFFGLSYVPEIASKKIDLSSGKALSINLEALNKSAFSDSTIKTLNTNMNKANIYLIRVIVQGNSKNKDLFLQKNGMLHFDDYKNFLEKSQIVSKIEEKTYFRKDDLPRLATASFIRTFGSQTGNLMSSFGVICYNIDNKLDLFSNIEYSVEKIITNVNYADFDEAMINRELCSPEKFKIGDQMVGYLNNGIFDNLTTDVLDKEQNIQDTYYLENVKKVQKDTLTSYLKLKYRRFFNYPRPTIPIFVVRENPVRPFFDSLLEMTGKAYVVGFFETLDPKRMRSQDFIFANNLKKELLNFIMRRYVNRGRLTIKSPKKNDEVRKLLIEIEKDILQGYPRTYQRGEFYVTREDYIRIIEILTGIQETREVLVPDKDEGSKVKKVESPSLRAGEGLGLKTFMRDPNIIYGTIDGTQFPLLRYISYFVLCEENESCNQVKNTGTPGVESMDILQNVPGSAQSYKMYYNSIRGRFNEVPL